jgi:predicted alpha/beta hydrolase
MSGEFTLTCPDGYELTATRFEPSAGSVAEIIVAGATAVPQRFYRRFAQYAQERGFSVTTLDYRGIGKSAPPNLRGFKAQYDDWAKQDIASAVNHVQAGCGGKPIYYVAHSFGGHALGQLPNHQAISRAYFYAVGAGWAGHMPTLERLKVNLMWHAIGPITVPILGYMPGRLIGGENLPVGIYRQWKHWCSFKHYFFDDPQAKDIAAGFANVQLSIAAANAKDDLWALPVSRDHFIMGYERSEITRIDIDPKQLGMPVGHMGYFRQGREALWDDCLKWLSLGKTKTAR